MKLINNWKRKLNLQNQLFETLNLDNNENPHLIKIGSTLNEKERKGLQALLMKRSEEHTSELQSP